jgi:hypothetical protein
MADVLRVIGYPQVSFSIVQPVIIDVVNNEPGGSLHYLPMHRDADNLSAFSTSSIPLGIKGIQGPVSAPLMLAEPLIIVGVNDGVFAPGQGYPAEGIAVAHPAIHKHYSNSRPD